tara:strand:+ start:445 stop:1338 length:894 start_codon:yes stop_codon:yes gene_type:complete
MGETITYDAATDTVTTEDNLSKEEQDSLQVGEKMMADQEGLLAGKYKSPKDLEKAYLELQRKQGEESGLGKLDKEPTEEVTEETPQFTQEDFYSEDGSVNYETANEVYGEQISKQFQDNGIDPFKMNEYFVENNGTLTDEMYTDLSKAGFNKAMVDSYLEGVRNQVGMEQAQAEAAPILSDAEVAEVHNIAGGKGGYEQLMEWASENISDADAKNFDEVIETGNKAAVTFAVKALMGQYEDAVGRDSNLVTGRKSSPQDVYKSMAQVVSDMSDPRYDKDEAFRDDVQEKLARSNLKV